LWPGGEGNVWEFVQETRNDQPAPIPVPPIDRIVSSTTARLILETFIGSGTTAISALNFGRDYIGLELSPDYVSFRPSSRRAIDPKGPQTR
jgi:site-specific DNA-methyltransferase (adenine-specific)